MTETEVPQHQSPENHLIVEDVVSALTGAHDGAGSEDMRHQLQRAAADFDKRTADAFGRALLDSLCDDPGNLRHLEALMILGLAHPDVLDSHRISLAVEGRRLAVLLERAGEQDRARTVLELLANHMPEERTIDHELAGLMRRSGNTDELVERYLYRAEQKVADGRISEAIPWLQEILLIDRTRRDVARMIRDLRYENAERTARRAKSIRTALMLAVVGVVLVGAVTHEVNVRKSFGEIPSLQEESLDSMRERHAGLTLFLDSNKVWTGYFLASRELSSLGRRISREERRIAEEQAAAQAVITRRFERANAARNRALMYAERTQFEKALKDFRTSIEEMDPTWEHYDQVQRDIRALEEHLGGEGK